MYGYLVVSLVWASKCVCVGVDVRERSNVRDTLYYVPTHIKHCTQTFQFIIGQTVCKQVNNTTQSPAQDPIRDKELSTSDTSSAHTGKWPANQKIDLRMYMQLQLEMEYMAIGGQVMGPRFIVEERVRVGYIHASIGDGSVSL